MDFTSFVKFQGNLSLTSDMVCVINRARPLLRMLSVAHLATLSCGLIPGKAIIRVSQE